MWMNTSSSFKYFFPLGLCSLDTMFQCQVFWTRHIIVWEVVWLCCFSHIGFFFLHLIGGNPCRNHLASFHVIWFIYLPWNLFKTWIELHNISEVAECVKSFNSCKLSQIYKTKHIKLTEYCTFTLLTFYVASDSYLFQIVVKWCKDKWEMSEK